ncbi:MAG: hypothetical protein LUG52_06585 [Clostridia bacterium]|nr:hypothetical protein [Clostridia bacterium]
MECGVEEKILRDKILILSACGAGGDGQAGRLRFGGKGRKKEEKNYRKKEVRREYLKREGSGGRGD